jgi:hypothetical protein
MRNSSMGRQLQNFITDEILHRLVFPTHTTQGNGLCFSYEYDSVNSCIYVTLGLKEFPGQFEMYRTELFIVTQSPTNTDIVISHVDDFTTRAREVKFKGFYEFFDFVKSNLIMIADRQNRN